MTKLKSNETLLKGTLRQVGASVEIDEEGKRIDELVNHYLVEVATDNSGWQKLYLDPSDNRYWELYYPDNELHGGGAPALKNIALEEARKRYSF
ncbi:Imm27 family immunity protein [Parapedobacter deserti]|uniref:Imm27 family immunity protein n=1 Tax=Parapedobacter deserti TaxID=1912957 RepID=A0ABV7JLW9_9SPHI